MSKETFTIIVIALNLLALTSIIIYNVYEIYRAYKFYKQIDASLEELNNMKDNCEKLRDEIEKEYNEQL